MPIPDLDTTIGGASANSYVSVDDATSYLDARLNTDAWTGALPDDKQRSLLMAASRLQVENWLGSRATTTQRLVWPRLYVQKVDSIGVGWGMGYGAYGWLFGDVYLSTEIPQQVKDAQCELALAYLEGFSEGGDDAMDSFSADGVSIKLRTEKPAGGLPSKVSQLIAALVAGNMLVRA
jgi:hypothetical protein